MNEKVCRFLPEAVSCTGGRRCERCGWNPDVACRRREALLRRMGVTPG